MSEKTSQTESSPVQAESEIPPCNGKVPQEVRQKIHEACNRILQQVPADPRFADYTITLAEERVAQGEQGWIMKGRMKTYSPTDRVMECPQSMTNNQYLHVLGAAVQDVFGDGRLEHFTHWTLVECGLRQEHALHKGEYGCWAFRKSKATEGIIDRQIESHAEYIAARLNGKSGHA